MEAKKSEVSPVYKKDSALEHKNHRCRSTSDYVEADNSG